MRSVYYGRSSSTYHFFLPSALFVASTLALAAASFALASESRLAAASSRCFLKYLYSFTGLRIRPTETPGSGSSTLVYIRNGQIYRLPDRIRQSPAALFSLFLKGRIQIRIRPDPKLFSIWIFDIFLDALPEKRSSTLISTPITFLDILCNVYLFSTYSSYLFFFQARHIRIFLLEIEVTNLMIASLARSALASSVLPAACIFW